MFKSCKTVSNLAFFVHAKSSLLFGFCALAIYDDTSKLSSLPFLWPRYNPFLIMILDWKRKLISLKEALRAIYRPFSPHARSIYALNPQ